MSALPTTAKFDRIYRSLLVADVHQQLSAFFPSRPVPEEDDLAYALSVATRLALSGNGDSVESADAGHKAYDGQYGVGENDRSRARLHRRIS